MSAPLELSLRATSIQLTPKFAQSVELVLTYVLTKQSVSHKKIGAL